MVPLHPHLGTVQTDLRFRRACKDFPPVAWFTTEISVPKCLILNHVILKQMDSGETVEVPISNEMANGIAMHRLALGFPVADIPVTAWPDHYGYNTPEGRELNETARDAGDEPDRWYISEGRVSLDHMSEIRIARSIQNLKMERNDGYLRDIKRVAGENESREGVRPALLDASQGRRRAGAQAESKSHAGFVDGVRWQVLVKATTAPAVHPATRRPQCPTRQELSERGASGQRSARMPEAYCAATRGDMRYGRQDDGLDQRGHLSRRQRLLRAHRDRGALGHHPWAVS
jgi:hypothetical protein